ncbi:MAG: dihydroorotate dehydrogenase (quinone), partial [Opitutus sp.]
MGTIYESVIRPLFFRLDPERAHEAGVRAMAVLGKLGPACRMLEAWHGRARSLRPVTLFGLRFPNLIGLAAGFDKNAEAWPAAAAMGFGHVEIGTITSVEQPGNPKPRVFRHPSQQAVINRMGFNNEGAAAVAARLARQRAAGSRRIPLGINLGKSKVAGLEQA